MVRGTARLISVWGSGQVGTDVLDPGAAPSGEGAVAVVLERADQFDVARESGLIGVETRAFVPGASDDADGPIVLGYDGSFRDPAGDVQIGGQFFVQAQDYGTSDYLSLVGPTLVKIVDPRDFDAFLADADTAATEGNFVDFATHSLVRLCDASSLGAAVNLDGPKLRLYIDANGVISTSPTGLPLGELGDDLAELDAAWAKINAASDRPCAVSLGKVVDEGSRSSALQERPWISRYHVAIGAVRNLRARGIVDALEFRVSGFGFRLQPDLADVAEPADLARDDLPVLVWTGDDAYLYGPGSERTFKLSPTTGAQVERLLVHGSAEAAATDDLEQMIGLRDHFDALGLPICDRLPDHADQVRG